MSTPKNKVQLTGFIGRDAEVKNLSGGKTVARASIAISEFYKNAKGESKDETYWHNLVLWGKLADEASEKMKKGAEVFVEGKLVSKSYENKEGKKVYVTEVWVSEFSLVEKTKAEESTASYQIKAKRKRMEQLVQS